MKGQYMRRWVITFTCLISSIVLLGPACDDKGAPVPGTPAPTISQQACEILLTDSSRMGNVSLGYHDWMTFKIVNNNDHRVFIEQIELEWIATDQNHRGWILGRTILVIDQFGTVFDHVYKPQGPARFRPRQSSWVEPQTELSFTVMMDATNASQGDWAQFYVVAISLLDENQNPLGIKNTPLEGHQIYIDDQYALSCQLSVNSPQGFLVPAQDMEVLRFILSNTTSEKISVQTIAFDFQATDVGGSNWIGFYRVWNLFGPSNPQVPLTSLLQAGMSMQFNLFDEIPANSAKEYVIRTSLMGATNGDSVSIEITGIQAVKTGFIVPVGPDPNAHQGCLIDGFVINF